jgi:hypothetical protein
MKDSIPLERYARENEQNISKLFWTSYGGIAPEDKPQKVQNSSLEPARNAADDFLPKTAAAVSAG